MVEESVGMQYENHETEIDVKNDDVSPNKTGQESNSGNFQPMEIAKSSIMSSKTSSIENDSGETVSPQPFQRLLTEERVQMISLNAVRFAVFADAINATIEQPNYPFMVSPGAHPESFPSTAPMDFSAATYFVPMTALLGVAISSTCVGMLSDKIGRKICILICLYGSVVFTIVKFFLKFNFWAYCGANFVNGLFSASVPVALAYVSDISPNKQAKENEIAVIVGVSMLGNSGGGICAILMQTQGLFAPLWVGIAMVAIAALVGTFLMIDPKFHRYNILKATADDDDDETVNEGNDLDDVENNHADRVDNDKENDDDDEEMRPPDKLNVCVLSNIIMGALADNVGSSGLLPLCLSPLAFGVYYQDFLAKGMAPVMSEVAYKWISVMVAITVIPATFFSPPIFAKIGASGGCVMGNLVTGVVTIALLYIASAAPHTTGWFAFFVVLLYISFPFTVVSQLSTGPMLDVISPVDKRGFVQGLNITVMNVGAAIAPFLLGTLADFAGTSVAIWTCVAISFLAAIVNVPLIFVKGLGVPPKKIPPESRALKGEDKDLVERALRGEWIPARDLDRINNERLDKGQPFLNIRVGTYEEDKERLADLQREAQVDYRFLHGLLTEYVTWAVESSNEEKDTRLEQANEVYWRSDSSDTEKAEEELGKWFVDYLKDNGYHATKSPVLAKQMIMTAFPTLTKSKEYTRENITQTLINEQRVYNRYVAIEEETAGSKAKSVLAGAQGLIYRQTY